MEKYLKLGNLNYSSVLLGLFTLAWAFGYFEAFLWTDDDMRAEKALIILLWILHTLDWLRKGTPQALNWKKPSPFVPVGLLLGFAGLGLGKISVLAIGFVCFFGGLLLMTRTERSPRYPLVMMASLAYLCFPSRIILYPISDLMRIWAADVPAWFLSLFYPGTFVEDFIIYVEHTYVNITEQCAGAPPMILVGAMAILSSITDRTYLGLIPRLVLAVPSALILNWVRIIAISIAAVHVEDTQWVFGDFHDAAGHICFALSILPLIWYSKLPDIWNEWIDELIAKFKKSAAEEH